MSFNFFIINPGSTSTKIAFFRGEKCIFSEAIHHDKDELSKYSSAIEQADFRIKAIDELTTKQCRPLSDIDAFVGRGGLLHPLKGGTYVVNDDMLDDLKSARYGDHASNLGAIIAAEFAQRYGKPAYIVDPPVVDELIDEARIYGLPFIKKVSVFHALNQKAVAMRAASEAGINYKESSFIVAHMGGGISVGAHYKGRVIDVNNALEEGPFTPERTGILPAKQLVELCFSGQYSKHEIFSILIGKGGLYSYTGTTDCMKLEKEIYTNKDVKLLFDGMVYRISREICACSAALYGIIDRIVLTGGLARMNYVIKGIKKRVSFLAPISVYPGEEEMVALAKGVLRVLVGSESFLIYEKRRGEDDKQTCSNRRVSLEES